MYLDALIGGQEMWTGVVPKVGRQFIQTVAIEGFPLESTPGILTALGELPCEYRWSPRRSRNLTLFRSLKRIQEMRRSR